MQAVTLQNNGYKIDNMYINTGMARQARTFLCFFCTDYEILYVPLLS